MSQEELLKSQETTIEQLKNEVAALKQKAEEEKTTAAVREVAATAHSKPTTVPSGIFQDGLRDKAIKAVGGKAFYMMLPMNERLRANGQMPATGEEIELSKRLFGPNSSALEASRMARHNPAQYSRLRLIHREL